MKEDILHPEISDELKSESVELSPNITVESIKKDEPEKKERTEE